MENSNKNDESNNKIFIKDKHGIYVLEPLKDKTTKLLNVDKASIVIQSKNYIGVVSEGIIHLYDNVSLNLIKKLDEYELVSNVHFSPSNDYLVIIQKPSINYNLKKLQFHSTTHPSSQWPQLKFSTDEDYVFKLIKGQLDIYKLKQENLTEIEKYTTITGVVNYEISEIKSDLLTDTAVITARVVTDEKSKKKKSLLTIYKLSDITKPVKEMTISVCDRMKIKVSPDKKFVLLNSISDDTSTTSYYGESSLYFLDLLYGKFNKISLPEGPIHDFDWVPDGSTFITCAGYQPSKTHIYNNQGKFVKELCVSKVSTIKVSHDSKLVCMAGFGNLNGDLEIYKLSDYAIIGKTKLYCGVSLNWSKDCKFLLGAVLSPRVRVDNEYKVFTYNGEDLTGEKFNGEIYECEWIDNNQSKYVEYKPEVSQVYLKNLQIEKEKQKNAKTLTNSLNSLSLNSGNKSSGIPGLKKK